VKFINDLQISLDDVVLVIMAYYLNTKELGRFTLEEWVTGFLTLEMDNIEKIKAGLPSLREQLKDPEKLSSIYKFSFNFYREDAKYVDLETADRVFEMLLVDKLHIPQIREFLKEQSTYKNIGKDQWMSIYDFSMMVGPKLEGYNSDDGTWPIMLDEFVEWSNNSKL